MIILSGVLDLAVFIAKLGATMQYPFVVAACNVEQTVSDCVGLLLSEPRYVPKEM